MTIYWGVRARSGHMDRSQVKSYYYLYPTAIVSSRTAMEGREDCPLAFYCSQS